MQDRIFAMPIWPKKLNFIGTVSLKEVVGDDLVDKIILDSGKELDLEGVFIAIGHKPNYRHVH